MSTSSPLNTPNHAPGQTRRPRRAQQPEVDDLSEHLSQLGLSGASTPLLFQSNPPSPSTTYYSPAQTTASIEGAAHLGGSSEPAVYNITINTASATFVFNNNGGQSAPASERRAPAIETRRGIAAPAATSSTAAPATPPAVATSTTSHAGTAVSARASRSRNARTAALGMRYSERIAWDPKLEHIDDFDARHMGKWYVVVRGTRVGIFRDWLEVSRFVNTIRGAVHKSFKTYREAEAYYTQNKASSGVWLLAV